MVRFTFSQIHQYFQYGSYTSDFQSLRNRLCKRDLSSSRVLMAIFTMLEEVSYLSDSCLIISFHYCHILFCSEIQDWHFGSETTKIVIDVKENYLINPRHITHELNSWFLLRKNFMGSPISWKGP